MRKNHLTFIAADLFLVLGDLLGCVRGADCGDVTGTDGVDCSGDLEVDIRLLPKVLPLAVGPEVKTEDPLRLPKSGSSR